MKGGFFDGAVLDTKGVEGIAGLPSREELLTQIAFGMNNVMSTLARAINAVAEKNAGGAAEAAPTAAE
jgi:large subunit ribosomal protein L10